MIQAMHDGQSWRLQGVLFDMDGVLIDAKEWHYEALNRALTLFGYSITRYEHLVTYDGLPTKKKLEMLSRDRGLPRSLHDCINDLKQIYTLELVHARCKPMFQHEYAISKLKSQGYKLGVASNAVRASVEIMLQKSGLYPHFDAILSNQDITRSKPHPEIYERVIAKLGVLPTQCLVVEDHPYGIEAATSAGAHVLQIDTVTDVTWSAITSEISTIEAGDERTP